MSDQDLWRRDIPADFEGKMADDWDGEIPMGPILWSAVAIVISFVIAVGFCLWLMNGPLESWREAMFESEPSPMAETTTRYVLPTPLLQPKPEAELDVWLEEMDARATGYGWVDSLDNRVHIPIDTAMQLVLAERGSAPASIEPSTEEPVDVDLSTDEGLSHGDDHGDGVDPSAAGADADTGDANREDANREDANGGDAPGETGA